MTAAEVRKLKEITDNEKKERLAYFTEVIDYIITTYPAKTCIKIPCTQIIQANYFYAAVVDSFHQHMHNINMRGCFYAVLPDIVKFYKKAGFFVRITDNSIVLSWNKKKLSGILDLYICS